MISKKYIAWDSSSATGVVVAFEILDGKFRLISEWSLSFNAAQHSERLLWTIDTVLKGAGWTIDQINGIGVGVGPGSFTGLRIGITTAKMIAGELKIPIIEISSLALIARGLAQKLSCDKKSENTLMITCTDATKGEWFTLLGSLKSIRDSKFISESAITPDEVIENAKKYLKKHSSAKWIAVGQSVERYPEAWKALPAKKRIELESTSDHLPQPRVLAQLMWESIEKGRFCDPLLVKPRYLRDSEAEVKLKKGLLKPSPVSAPLRRVGIA